MKKKEIIIGRTKQGQDVMLASNTINKHMLFTGISGSGKSTAMLSMALQQFFAGNRVVVINWRRCLDAGAIMRELADIYYENSTAIDVAAKGLRMPLFTNLIGKDRKREDDLSVIKRVGNMLQQACKLNATQASLLNVAVEHVFKMGKFQYEGIRVVNKFLRAQDYHVATNAAGRLSAICDTNAFVDGNFLDDIDGKICEINLNGLQYDDATKVLTGILDTLLRFANAGMFMQDPIWVMIDECHNLDLTPGATLATILNESRKLGLNVLLATPSILTAGTKKLSVLQQCGSSFYFKAVDNDRRKLAKLINPGDVEGAAYNLQEIGIGQFYFSGRYVLNGVENNRPVVLDSYLTTRPADPDETTT